MATLFECKSIESLIADAPSSALPKTLSLFSLMCFGVGSTIGAGIFVLTGTVAAEHAGPDGSAYTYAYATLGEAASLRTNIRAPGTSRSSRRPPTSASMRCRPCPRKLATPSASSRGP